MSWDDEERRVADILGVQEGGALPGVSRHTLRTYHAYLIANLPEHRRRRRTSVMLSGDWLLRSSLERHPSRYSPRFRCTGRSTGPGRDAAPQ
jgi:hypothetical protein